MYVDSSRLDPSNFFRRYDVPGSGDRTTSWTCACAHAYECATKTNPTAPTAARYGRAIAAPMILQGSTTRSGFCAPTPGKQGGQGGIKTA